jgi:hypothetical protein
MNIPEKEYEKIEDLIGSDESVVGIDAKKTHIIIIHMLSQIQNQLDDIENRLEVIEDQIDT